MSLKQESTENKNEVKLTITVDKKEFEDAIISVFNKSKGYFNIPGFRKGKAPYNIVERHYGPEIFYEDAFNEVADKVYPKELKENNIEAVSKPKIDIIQMEKGKDLIFTAIVSTKPDFKLGKYKGIALNKTKREVTDKDAQHELEHLADHNSRMVTVEDRACKSGDTVNIDFDGSVDGVPFEGGKSEDYPLVLGSNSFIPGFEDQVIGMKIDEEKDITVTFPEDYHEESLQGKEAVFKIKLHSIKEKELPKIDDEFAKDVSEFDTLADLKKDIKKKQEEKNEHETKHELEDQAIDVICENTDIEIPEGMIELEIDSQVDDMDQRLRYQGLKLEQYLQYMGQTIDELRNSMKDQAVKSIKARLVLEKIIEEEKIEADKKFIDEKMDEMIKQYKYKKEDLEKNENIMDYLNKSSKQETALKLIIDNAKITEVKDKSNK